MTEIPVDLPHWLRWGVYILQQVGFPVAVAGWVLYKLNGRIGALTEVMGTVATAFQSVKEVQRQQTDFAKDAVTHIIDEIRESRHR